MKKLGKILSVIAFSIFLYGCIPGLAANYKIGEYETLKGSERLNRLCNKIGPIAVKYELTQRPKQYEETICTYMDDKGIRSMSVGVRQLYGHVLVTINTMADQGRNEEFKQLKEQIEDLLSSEFPDYKVKD